MMRTRTAIAAGGLAVAAALGTGACGTLAAYTSPREKVVTVTPAASQATTPAPTVTVTAPSAEATAQVPARPTVQAPAEAPQVTDPWAVVSAYYGDIESGNFTEAWNLLSPGMQDQLGPYDGWAAGYNCTSGDSVSENYESGDTVSVNITSSQCDGSNQFYSGTYTVTDGKIASASISRN